MHTYTCMHTCTHIDGNAVGFFAERTGRDVSVSSCNGTLRSVITFSCDSDVAWYSSHNDVTNHLVSFLNDQADECLVSTGRFGHTFIMHSLPDMFSSSYCNADFTNLHALPGNLSFYCNAHFTNLSFTAVLDHIEVCRSLLQCSNAGT